MQNDLAEDVLGNHMLALMKAYKDTIEDPSSLDGTIMFLEQCSKLVVFANDHRPLYTVNATADLNQSKVFLIFLSSGS